MGSWTTYLLLSYSVFGRNLEDCFRFFPFQNSCFLCRHGWRDNKGSSSRPSAAGLWLLGYQRGSHRRVLPPWAPWRCFNTSYFVPVNAVFGFWMNGVVSDTASWWSCDSENGLCAVWSCFEQLVQSHGTSLWFWGPSQTCTLYKIQTRERFRKRSLLGQDTRVVFCPNK